MTKLVTLDNLLPDVEDHVSYEEYELIMFEQDCSLLDAAIEVSDNTVPFTAAILQGTTMEGVEIQFEGISDVGKAIAKGFLKVIGFIAKILYKLGTIIIAPFIFIVNKIRGKSFKETAAAIKVNWGKIDKKIDGWIPVSWNKQDDTKATEIAEAAVVEVAEITNDLDTNITKLVSMDETALDKFIELSRGTIQEAENNIKIYSEFLQKYKEKSPEELKEKAAEIAPDVNALVEWAGLLNENKIKGLSKKAKDVAKQLEKLQHKFEQNAAALEKKKSKNFFQQLISVARGLSTITIQITSTQTQKNLQMAKNLVVAEKAINAEPAAA
jgi:conjugal transfer/entry exclusion protein